MGKNQYKRKGSDILSHVFEKTPKHKLGTLQLLVKKGNLYSPCNVPMIKTTSWQPNIQCSLLIASIAPC